MTELIKDSSSTRNKQCFKASGYPSDYTFDAVATQTDSAGNITNVPVTVAGNLICIDRPADYNAPFQLTVTPCPP